MWRKCWGVMHRQFEYKLTVALERLGFPVSIIGTREDTERSVFEIYERRLKSQMNKIFDRIFIVLTLL